MRPFRIGARCTGFSRRKRRERSKQLQNRRVRPLSPVFSKAAGDKVPEKKKESTLSQREEKKDGSEKASDISKTSGES